MKRVLKRLLGICLCMLLFACPAGAESYRTLRNGETSADVAAMQGALSFLQYPVRQDGVFDAGTEQAVTAFQLAQGLTADGRAGSATLTRLYGLAPQFKPGGSAKASQPQAAGRGTLRMGDEADSVRVLQQRLIDLGYLNARADAVYGQKTKEAVALFQQINGLKADGKAGEATLNLLYSAAARPNAAPLVTAAPAPTAFAPLPTAAPKANLRRGTLRMGDEADSVRVLQQRLIDLGYLKARADAVYGQKTKEAVALFQQMNSLKADGKAGKATLDLLYSAAARPNAAPLATAVPATPVPTAFAPLPTVVPQANPLRGIYRPGDEAEGVRVLQQRLIDLGYLKGRADAVYGQKTKEAVTLFQQANSLKADGKAGETTLALLFSPSAKALPQQTATPPAPSQAPAPQPTQDLTQPPAFFAPLKMDSADGSGTLVSQLQTRLKALGYPVSADGLFGVATHEAVVAFQRINGLTPSGIADVAMQKVLYSSAAKPYSAQSSAPALEGGGAAPGNVRLLHWFKEVKPSLRTGQNLSVYHPKSGASFTLRIYSLGRHADAEPLTLADTQRMNKAFGAPSWNVNAVYVKLPSGQWTLAAMHNRPHLSGSISDNGFGGHLCVHFLRDMEEAQKNDPNYGVTNQKTIRSVWKSMTGETLAY